MLLGLTESGKRIKMVKVQLISGENIKLTRKRRARRNIIMSSSLTNVISKCNFPVSKS